MQRPKKKAPPPSLTISQELRERIANQHLPPGSRIEETKLATEFGMSRTVIREALGLLEQRGLIVRIPNRGAIVKRLEPKEIYEIFDVREVLEGLCARQATVNAPTGAWQPFHDGLGEEMRRTIEQGDIHVYDDALDRLRDEMLRIADNSHVTQMLSVVLDKARVIRRRVTLLPGRAELGRQMHRSMLEAMMAGDAALAEKIKRDIIRSACDALRRYHDVIL